MSATPVPGGCGWRVVVVDDSIVVRASVRAMLQADPLVAMIETARSAPAALAVLERHVEDAPIDVVLLDVEMPSMSGIEALPHLLRASPTSRVVMASSLTRRGAAVTMAALAAGASDYSCKPQAAAAEARQAFAADLSTKVAIWGADARRARRESATPPRRPAPPVPEPATRSPATTGGPQALLQLFAALPGPFACPIFITQHMPPAFTAMLAEQIGRFVGGVCREAEDGEPVVAGRIYVARGTVISRLRAMAEARRVFTSPTGRPRTSVVRRSIRCCAVSPRSIATGSGRSF